jgi:regulator of sirC expression with transglutaminase-like and TPR domain
MRLYLLWRIYSRIAFKVCSRSRLRQGTDVIIETIKSRRIFTEIAAIDEESFPLDRAALAIALEEYPGLDMTEYLRRLDTLAARVEVLAGPDRTPINYIESINEILFVQEGLRGNSEDYYDPRNSYINQVLDRKLGIPVSLSLVYMEVARRIDFSVKGVGFPGHFLAKHVSVSDGREIIIDPFNMGKILTANACQELLDKFQSSKEEVSSSMLQPMEKRAIITRMLYNLKGIYMQKEQHTHAISIIEKILLLNPGISSEICDRGILYMQTSLFGQALADLEFYLSHTAAPEDSLNIQNHIKMLRGIVCATN